MGTGFLHLHGTLRWVMLVLLAFALFNSIKGWMGKKEFTNGHRKVLLFTLISSHVMLLLGIALFFINGWHKVYGMEDWMSTRGLRFWALEHPLQMIVGVALITAAHSRAKKRKGMWTAHRTSGILLLVATLLILAAIPWPFYGEIGRPLFPGM